MRGGKVLATVLLIKKGFQNYSASKIDNNYRAAKNEKFENKSFYAFVHT
jgi:hypothetical protein